MKRAVENQRKSCLTRPIPRMWWGALAFALTLAAADPALAQSWKRVGTVTTLTNGQLCKTDGTNVICDNTTPFIDGSNNVGIGTNSPQSMLHIYNGEVQIGSSGASCSGTTGGALRYASNTVYYCNGTNWTTVAAGGSLPSLTNGSIWVGNGSNVATAVALSQDVTITNAGVATVGKIQNVSVGAPTGTAGSGVVLATSPTIAAPTLTGTTAGASVTWSGTESLTLGTDLTTTGSQNNVNVGTASAVRYAGAGTATFTGIVAGSSGQVLYLHNASASTLTLSNLSASSTAANQIITGTSADLGVPTNTSVTMQYDPTATNSSGNTGAWRVTGSSNSANTLAAGSTGQIQFNGGTNLAADSNLTWDNTNKRLGIGSASPVALLNLGGNISASAWTTAGIDLATNAATYTDTSTVAAGTVATRAANSFGLPTLASTNAITVTNGSNLYIAGGAVKGANTTLTNSYGEYIAAGAVGAATNSYGLYVNAQTGATNNYGAVFASGNVGIGTTAPIQALDVAGRGAFLNTANSNYTSSGATIIPSNSYVTVLSNFSANDNTATFVANQLSNSSSLGQRGYFGFISQTGAANYSPAFVIGRSTGSSSYAETFRIDQNGNIAIGTSSPTNILSLGGGSAQTFWMERNPTANTAGNGLTVQAGGATSAATDKNGGSLTLSAGTATGTGSSSINFQTATAQGSTNTTDNAPTTKMTILGNGDVGIGTATPTQPVHIYGTASYAGMFKVDDGTESTLLDPIYGLSFFRSGAYINNNTVGGKITIRTSNASTQDTIDMTILANGNVGIGTTSPNGAFDVYTNGAASTPAVRVDGTWYSGGTATTTKPQMLIEPTGTTSTGWSTTGTGLGVNAASGFTGKLIDAEVNGTWKFRVDYQGNVNGGNSYFTTSSAQLYDTTVYASTGATAQPSTSNAFTAQNNAAVDSEASTLILQPRNSSSNYQSAYISAISNAGAGVYTPTIVIGQQTGSTAYAERMRIDSSGNVGIGTATPQSKLHIQAGEVQVGSSGTACSATIGGAVRFSGSTLYYCDGSSTWQSITSSAGGLPSLANGSIWVGNGSSMATAVALSQDVTITNAGVATVGKIQNVSVGAPTGTAGSGVVLATSPTIAAPTLTGTTAGASVTWSGTESLTLGTDLTTTGSQNNVNVGTASAVRYAGAGTATFTGIVAGSSGQVLYLHNASASTLTLSNLSASSTAANQIITGTGAALGVPTNTSVTMQYDPTATNSSGNTGAWRVTGSSNSANTLAAGSTGQIQFNGGTNLAADSNLTWDNTNKRLGIGTGTPGSLLHIYGSVSAPAWTTNGIALREDAATYTDTSSSGTVAATYANVLKTPTLAASSTTTYTNAATLYLGGISAGSNVTITNPYSLYAIGNGFFGGSLTLNNQSNGIFSATQNATLDVGNTMSTALMSTTYGRLLKVNGPTLTDTVGSGTVAARIASSFAAPTFAASSTETITNAATVYISGAPSAGSNVTITNPLALYVAAGTSSFAGNVGIGTTSPATALDVNGVIVQRPAAAASTANYMWTNASGAVSTTNLNPGLLVSSFSGYQYGLDLGYVAGTARYRNRLFAPNNGDISFAFHAASVDPTAQSSFTDAVTIRGDTGNVGIGTTTPTYDLSFGAAARKIWVERAASGAGNNLTITAGGAKSGATDAAGGNLILSAGTSTGAGASQIQFQAATAGASNTNDRTPQTYMTIDGATGSINFGGNASPSSSYSMFGSNDPTNNVTNQGGFRMRDTFYVTSGTNNNSNYSISAYTTTNVSVGASATGTYSGLVAYGLASGAGTTSNLVGVYAGVAQGSGATGATIGSVKGVSVDFGNITYANTLTNAYGLYVQPYHATGTVTNSYGLYLASPQTGGTVTNEYALYQASTTAKSYFAGNVGIGTATPQSKLHIQAGEVQVGSSGTACSATIGGAVRFSGSTLYYCDGSSTWQSITSSAGGLPSLANGSIWVGNGSSVATAVALSQDVTITNAGVTTVGKIQNVSVGAPTGTAGSGVVLATSPTIAAPTLTGTTAGASVTWSGTESLTLGTDLTTTGSQNNVNVGTASAVRYAGAGAATFTGIVAGSSGQVLYLHNASASTLTLSNKSASSTAANQIVTGTAADLSVPTNTSVTMQYDPTATNSSGNTGAWRVTGSSNSANTLAAGTTGQVQFNGGTNLAADSNLFWDNTNKRLGIGIAVPTAQLHLAGGASAAAWTTNGIGIRQASATYTDTSSSGVVSGNYVNILATPTLAASSSTTYSTAATLRVIAPTAGSNVTIGNGYALYASGNSRFDGLNGFGTSNPNSIIEIGGNLSASSWTTAGLNFAVDASTLTDTSTAAAGTVATRTANSLGLPTLASTNAITVTDGSNLYIAGGAAKGANTTLTNSYGEYIAAGAVGAATNSYGLYVNAQTGATNNYGAVFASGNVGIGTTAPSYLLSIKGADTNNATLSFVLSDSTGASIVSMTNAGTLSAKSLDMGAIGGTGRAITRVANISNDAAAGVIIDANQASGSVIFQTGGTTERMRIDNAGNVGIGTTSPTNLLSLGGGSAQTFWMERNPTANTAGNGLTVQAGGATSAATDKNGGSLTLSAGTATGTGSSSIAFQTATAQGSTNTTDNAPTTKMTITGAGNVGIGTASPSATLDVGNSSGSALRVVPVTSEVNYVQINGSATGTNPSISGFGSDTNVGLSFNTQGTGNINLRTGNNIQAQVFNTASAVDYLTFTGGATGSPGTVTISAAGTDTNVNIALTPKGSGNVGIGTTSPQVKLDVAGAIYSRSNNAGSSTSIDWSLANTQYTTASCGAFTFTNMQDGGTYQLFVEGTTSGTCSFSQSGLTFKLPPNHGATTASTMTAYSFTRAGSNVFVAWVPGY